MDIEIRLIGTNLDNIVSGMNRIQPENKFSSGKSYKHIASEYLDKCVMEMLQNLTANNTIPEVSITSIRNNFTYRYNRKYYWWNYLYSNYPLWMEIQKGYNVSDNHKQLTQIKPLVSLTDILYYRMNRDFGDYFRNTLDTKQQKTATPINKTSILNAQQIWAQQQQYKNVVLCQNLLDQAEQDHIISNAEFKNNMFGLSRMYMKGANNLQGIRKPVREAALGDCFRYDINSSVFAYQMHIIKTHTPDVKTPCMMELLDNKTSVRSRLASECLPDTNATTEFKHKIIKQSLTALSFGSNPNSWASGIAEYIYSDSDRNRFRTNPYVVGLAQEIKQYRDIIRKLYPKKQFPGVNIATLCSNHYQAQESLAIRQIISETQTDPLLIVHDCIYTRKPLDSIHATYILQKHLGNYAKFECKKIIAWYDKTLYQQQIAQEIAHHNRILQEELTAQHKEKIYG